MDAVEFLKENDRMCKTFDSCCDRESGEICELYVKSNEKGLTCPEYASAYPEEAVAIVEQWAKDHPRKTRQEKFLEMFPKTNVDANNVITICPYETCIDYKCDLKWGESTASKCRECRKNYWLEEVE